MQTAKVNTYKQSINKAEKGPLQQHTGPPALRERPGGADDGRSDQAMEVSSIRKLVPSEESSVPVNVSVTVLPA